LVDLNGGGTKNIRKRDFLLLNSLEAQPGNLSRVAMDLMIAKAVDFAAERLSDLVNHLDIFLGAGTDKAVPEQQYGLPLLPLA
jgi:hypothetical protein